MDHHRGKFGDCSFSRFGFIVRTDRHTDRHTDTTKRFTPATVVGVNAGNYRNIRPHQVLSACSY